MDLLAFLLARAKEPSSYAGLAMVLSAAGIHFSDLQFNAIVNLLIALAGALAIFVPEGRGDALRSLAPLAVLGGLTGLLSACNGTAPSITTAGGTPAQQVQAVAVQVASDVASGAQALLAAQQVACAAYAPVAASLAPIASGNKTVGNILLYGNSVCDPATGTVQPGVALDTGTAAWTGAITGVLKGFASFAVPAAAAPAAPASGS